MLLYTDTGTGTGTGPVPVRGVRWDVGRSRAHPRTGGGRKLVGRGRFSAQCGTGVATLVKTSLLVPRNYHDSSVLVPCTRSRPCTRFYTAVGGSPTETEDRPTESVASVLGRSVGRKVAKFRRIALLGQWPRK